MSYVQERTRMLRTSGALGRQLNSGYLNTEFVVDESCENPFFAGTWVERRRSQVIIRRNFLFRSTDAGVTSSGAN
jgi:hypothetical protein